MEDRVDQLEIKVKKLESVVKILIEELVIREEDSDYSELTKFLERED